MTSDPFTDLPSLEDVRRQLLTAAITPARRRRALSPVSRRQALVVVVALSVPVAAGIAAMSRSDEDRNVGWQPVAQGEDPTFGRYEIVRGDANHRFCVGISLPDQDPPGVARAVAATCANNSALGVAFMRGQAGTLAYGLTTAETRTVTLGGRGRAPLRARLFDGPGDTRYFIVSTPTQLQGAEITARDQNGSVLAQQASE